MARSLGDEKEKKKLLMATWRQDLVGHTRKRERTITSRTSAPVWRVEAEIQARLHYGGKRGAGSDGRT